MMKTVVLLGSYGPSLVNFRGPLVAKMAAAGHRVVAAAPDLDLETASRLRGLGAEPLALDARRTGMNPLQDLVFYRSLIREFRRIRPDIVLAYTAKPIVWGAPAARAAEVPTVAAMITGLGFAFTDGGGHKRRLARWVLSALYRRALPLCDAIMFQNPDDRDYFARLGLLREPEQVSIVNGSGIDLARFSAAPPPSRNGSFLMIARLLGDKGVREYCAAALKVKAIHPQAKFRLIGYLDESPDCIASHELRAWIDQGIEYLGRQDDVRAALADADVYVLPSYREGTPRSVLEAMAVGRAVITTDAPGCRETVIDGRNGRLVPVRDVDALAAAMVEFIENPSMAVRMGAASRRMAEDHYDVRKVNASILARLGLAH